MSGLFSKSVLCNLKDTFNKKRIRQTAKLFNFKAAVKEVKEETFRKIPGNTVSRHTKYLHVSAGWFGDEQQQQRRLCHNKKSLQFPKLINVYFNTHYGKGKRVPRSFSFLLHFFCPKYLLLLLPLHRQCKCVIVIADRSGESTNSKEPPTRIGRGRRNSITNKYVLLFEMQLDDACLAGFVILAKLQYYLLSHHQFHRHES